MNKLTVISLSSFLQLVFVGRLDVNSEGLLLMTNSGELARQLEMGAGLIERKYRVRVHGIVAPWKLNIMRKGLTVEGVRYKPMEVSLEHDKKKGPKRTTHKKGDKEKEGGTNTWLHFTCTEGKNRQIRKICKHLNLDVSRLIRVGYGPYSLEGCDRGGFLKVLLSFTHFSQKNLITMYFFRWTRKSPRSTSTS